MGEMMKEYSFILLFFKKGYEVCDLSVRINSLYRAGGVY